MLGISRVVTVASVVVAYNWNEILPACFISVLTAASVCELKEIYLELHNCYLFLNLRRSSLLYVRDPSFPIGY